MRNGEKLRFKTAEDLKQECSYKFRLDVSTATFECYQKQRDVFDQIKLYVLTELTGCYELLPQMQDKLSFMVPQDQQVKIADLLRNLQQLYPNFYPDIYMNSLEDAYLHIYNYDVNQFIKYYQ